MVQKIDIIKIVLRIKNAEIALTLEEAKELRKVLNNAFQDQVWTYPVVVNPVAPVYPSWYTTTDDHTVIITNEGT